MSGTIPLFVLGADDRIAALAVKVLAVAGGYLAGYVLGGVFAWATDRWVFKHKIPDVAKKMVQIVAGIALAILVALIVFGEGGGGGLFGGGGPAEGQGQGTTPAPDASKEAKPPTPPDKPPVKVDPIPVPMGTPDAPHVKVTFLGGMAASGDRLYYLGDDQVPRTFEEVRAALEDLQRRAPEQGYLLLVFPSDPKLAIDEKSRNVTKVMDEAKRLGIETRRP